MVWPEVFFFFRDRDQVQPLAPGPTRSKRQRWDFISGSLTTVSLGWVRGPHQFRVRRGNGRVPRVGRGGTDPSQPQCLPHPHPGGTVPLPPPASAAPERTAASGCGRKPSPGVSSSTRGAAALRPEPQPAPPTPPTLRAAAPRPAGRPRPSLPRPALRPAEPRSILGDRRGPARSLAERRLRGGRARARPGRGRKVAAARRGGRRALTRMFTPGHPGKWKRRALLLEREPQTPGPGPPPTPPPW